jgi:hypothetical protein
VRMSPKMLCQLCCRFSDRIQSSRYNRYRSGSGLSLEVERIKTCELYQIVRTTHTSASPCPGFYLESRGCARGRFLKTDKIAGWSPV